LNWKNRYFIVFVLVWISIIEVQDAIPKEFVNRALMKGTATYTLPGAKPFKTQLKKELTAMKKIKGQNYTPRTKHLRPDGSAMYTNRLFLESSPYLLQHAHNPVNWYPWGDEAFEAAKSMKRPVLVSIGYSTCHWCHVMEEESFEDEEIARFLNENYVAVKVDREERPDIDAVYMSAVQALTGRGGWPLNVWLTPDKKPFYGGTYFPARDGDRGVGAGFLTILKKLEEIFHAKRETINEASMNLTLAVQNALKMKAGNRLPGPEILQKAAEFFQGRFDSVHGGLQGAPKFPSSLPIRFLLRQYRRTKEKDFLDMANLALEQMAAGGMYDQVGGGFHRYSTDEQWLVPHFEKMLYDNALLVIDYLEGYQITGNPEFKRIVQETLQYVSREMTSPEGGFFSATDADSMTPSGHREEGYFFTWTPDELDDILGRQRAGIVRDYYSVGSIPNFEGRNILFLSPNGGAQGSKGDMSQDEFKKIISDSKALLYRERSKRPRPLRDEKTLTAWNGLMISAFARAGFALGDDDYVERAIRAARFILDHLLIKDRLYRSYKDGKARHKAYLDDYAFFTAALLDLYETTHQAGWLEKAIDLESVLAEFYEDPVNGGFFRTASDHEKLIMREKPNYDGAEPSGNSVAVLNLLRLYALTTKASYLTRAEKVFKGFLGNPATSPAALTEMLLALDFYLDNAKEIIIVTPAGKEHMAEPFLAELKSIFLPNRVLSVLSSGNGNDALVNLVPAAGNRGALDRKATAYVCEKGICKLPATDPKVFAKQLQE